MAETETAILLSLVLVHTRRNSTNISYLLIFLSTELYHPLHNIAPIHVMR